MLSSFTPTQKNVFMIAVSMILLPLMGESVYAPALPLVARDFAVSESLAEQSFAVYLLGSAFGVFLFGHLSDQWGRKPVILTGLGIFVLASGMAFMSNSYRVFIIARFFQAFGGGVSVLSTSINRDVFDVQMRLQLSAWIGTCVSLAPAVGAMLGAKIVSYLHWQYCFVPLMLGGVGLMGGVWVSFQETKKDGFLVLSRPLIFKQALRVMADGQFLFYTSIIGLGLGFFYTFMTEGAFYFMERLHLSKMSFGYVVTSTACCYAMGSTLTGRLMQVWRVKKVMLLGVVLMGIGSFSLLLAATLIEADGFGLGSGVWRYLSVIGCDVACFGISVLLTPSFALALEKQRLHVGMASSWFALLHNLINALVNFGMNVIHGASLYLMPMYFLCLTSAIVLVFIMGFDRVVRSSVSKMQEEVCA